MTGRTPVDWPARDDVVALRHFGHETEWRVSADLPQHLQLVSTVTGQRRNMTKRAYRAAASGGRARIVARGPNEPLGVPVGRPPAS